MNVTLTAAASV